jgi:hypothetical protein
MDISAIRQSNGMLPSQETAKNAGCGKTLPTAAANSGVSCKVDLSTRGKILSGLPPLMFPSRENVQKLSASLIKDLKKMFSQAGISSMPPVEFTVDSYTGEVGVKDNRSDAGQIAGLIKENPAIELQIHNIAAMSSHVVGMEKAMEANQAYQAAESQAEVDRAIARYSAVYSQNGPKKVVDFSLLFNGKDVQVNADGKLWLSSRE